MLLDCNGRQLNLSEPQVMGILNITPDSFSDGGRWMKPEQAITQAQQMQRDGAAIIDIGGESTRPGAEAVSVQQELDRVIPVIERLLSEIDLPLSIDTSKPEVMQEAVGAGAGMVNDVYGLRQPGAVAAVAELNVPVCIMHMQGEPRTMQQAPHYEDVVEDVYEFLAERVAACVEQDIDTRRILVDPGFGFGKTLEHNLRLLRFLPRFEDLGSGVLVGMSRKSMIGAVLDRPVEERLAGSLSLATLAAWQGAKLIRVHDVKESADAVRMASAVAMVSV